jgi:uncharacterized membrane protein YadS
MADARDGRRRYPGGVNGATLFVCVAVSLIGTIAMILYPTLTELAAWDSATSAVFLGASIHELAQVVGAAFALSPEQGELATLTKLLRVALLASRRHGAAAVLHARRRCRRVRREDRRYRDRSAIPRGVHGTGYRRQLRPLAQPLVEATAGLSRMWLLTAIAALGLQTYAGSLLRFGWRPPAPRVALKVLIVAVAALGETAAALLTGTGAGLGLP